MADDMSDRRADPTGDASTADSDGAFGPGGEGPFGPDAFTADADGADNPDAPVADAPDDAYRPPRELRREAAVASAGLLVVAAVLCVVAPFRAVYTLRSGAISASFDGWGRYDLATASQHGPRYGVALTVAAIVLVVAAASRLRDLRPVPGPEPDEPDVRPLEAPPAVAAHSDDRLATGIGVAGSALLLGVLASVALNIQSTLDNADSIAATAGGSASVDVGAMLWVMLAAWVVSVAGVWLPWYEARRRAWVETDVPDLDRA